MAKGTGLIGNFKGKVGNTVGYKLSASNNGQTQGIRVYQPIVKNPKTAAQAEQRAKLAPINATYRALKMIIDRGNEGLPYGNRSRLAWLKTAFKTEVMPWFEKGGIPNYPVVCQLTKGSLSGFETLVDEDALRINVTGVTAQSEVDTVGKVSTLLLNGYPQLKDGDQVTIVLVGTNEFGITSNIESFIIDSASDTVMSKFSAGAGSLTYVTGASFGCAAVIVSRLGDNGEHLRSTSSLIIANSWEADAPYDADSKSAAIASYQSSGYVNTDWQEESIQ